MRLDPINGIRDGLKIDLDSLNTFISNSTDKVNTVASQRNDVVNTLGIIDNTTSVLPRAMADNVGIVLISQTNDSTLYLPLAKFLYNTDGMVINHSIFPKIQAFYIIESTKVAKAITANGADDVYLMGSVLDRASDTTFSITYTVTANNNFDTLLVMLGNDSDVDVNIDYDDVTDKAKVANAFIYKFPYGLKQASFTFAAPLLNGKYIAQIKRVIAGNSNLNTSFTASTIPYTALIPNAKYKADLLCTNNGSSVFSLYAVNDSNTANILTLSNGVKSASIVSNHRGSFTNTSTLSGGATTIDAGFPVDESATYCLLGDSDSTYPTKFLFDDNGLLHSFAVIDDTLQIPDDLNATFYDVNGKRIYKTLDGGIYEIVYSYADKGQVLSLFNNLYAIKVDNNNITINGSSVTATIDTSDSSTYLSDILDGDYVPSGLSYVDTSDASYNGSGVEIFGCDVFTSTSYVFNGTIMDIQLPVTALANTNSDLTAVIKVGNDYIVVDDGQFLYSEDTSGNKYVLCRIDTTKHKELVNVTGATVYALAMPKYESDSSANASATFDDTNIVYGLILRGDKNTSINVFVDKSSVYSGKLKEFVPLGITQLKNVSIIADKTIGVAFVAPSDVQTNTIYAPALKKLTTIATSASTYSFVFKDYQASTITTITQADSVNLDTNVNPVFTIFTSDVDAIKDASLTWSYTEPNAYITVKEFIGYETETFSLSASFDGVGFVPSAKAIVVTSVR